MRESGFWVATKTFGERVRVFNIEKHRKREGWKETVYRSEMSIGDNMLNNWLLMVVLLRISLSKILFRNGIGQNFLENFTLKLL